MATANQLQELSDEVGPERTLLVLCTAFRARGDRYPNLTVRKIPKQVLARCEWGYDDYSLQVENLPKAPEVPEIPEDPDALTPGLTPGGREGKRNPAQQELEL